MLKDRIKFTQNGFSVIRDLAFDRKAVFGFYSLDKDPETIPEHLQEIKYWDPLDATEKDIPEQMPCVYVAEKEEEHVVEEARVIKTRQGHKPILQIRVEPNKKYDPRKERGKKAYMITIAWPDSQGENINSGYIFLAGPGGEQFPFLKDVIAPLSGHSRPEDQYVYILPEGTDPQEYHVEILPILRDRYQIMFSGM